MLIITLFKQNGSFLILIFIPLIYNLPIDLFANFIFHLLYLWKDVLFHYTITREYTSEDAAAVRIDLTASVSSALSPEDLVSNYFFLVSLLPLSKEFADIVGSQQDPFNLL